jgi:formamidopyrimidine-DNA glycosylase
VPELPEVEVVRRGLTTHLVGRRIAGVEVYHDRAVRRHAGGAADFRAVLPGHSITAVRRLASTCGGPWTTATPSSRIWE